MKYTRWRVWFILLAVTAGVIFILQYAVRGPGLYRSGNPITDTLVTNAYPKLYADLSKRDADLLHSYLNHESMQVRNQAWRALANTPVDSLGPLIDLAINENSDAGWFAISHHTLTGTQLRMLEKAWSDNPAYRTGIALVLGKQGDRQSLDFLLRQINNGQMTGDYQTALAAGRLIMRHPLDEEEQITVIRNAFDTSDNITRAYLYGWYRGAASPLTSTARDTLRGRWQELGPGTRTRIDQPVLRILGEKVFYKMVIYYNSEDLLDYNVQIAIEMAQALSRLELNDQHRLAAKILLTNVNPHVQKITLRNIAGKLSSGGSLRQYIEREMLTDRLLESAVWVEALAVAAEWKPELVETYEERLSEIPEENPYLLPEVLSVYEKIESGDEFIERIEGYVSGDHLKAMLAVQKLAEYRQSRDFEDLPDSAVEQLRKIVFGALEMKDRGVAFAVQPLLQDEHLFTVSDFNRINRSLSAFTLPEDIEVYQAFGSLYKDRFEQASQHVIDSLSSLGYAPLNRSLSEAGWNVDLPQNTTVNFRLPDWDRLWELGPEPVLRLRTERGDIFIRMNTLHAPATVSAIDSLSRAGVYQDIPFHRVVPNFVIQGGDIERADGMGGPDFIIPTEGSEQDFDRGAAGIASAGTDTEGSQYFIMHQWKPHLNGNYTRFGKVVDGMKVVDNIMVGDKVLFTTWY